MFECSRRMDSVFLIQSVSLCFFIGELSPFILKDINDQRLLVPVTLVFLVSDDIVCGFSFFVICCCEIIYCLCFSGCCQVAWVGVFLLVLCGGLYL